MEKENPHRHIVDKSRWGLPKPFWMNPMSTPLVNQCKPDAEKRKPPLTKVAKVSGGHRTANGVNPMSTPTSCFTDANPMPRKRKPPLTGTLEPVGVN